MSNSGGGCGADALVRRGGLARGRGFSLIELMIVLLIIVLVVSLIVPALGSARKAARKADTTNLMSSVNQGVSQFILDERRVPGYFTPAEMGRGTNKSEGFSAMQNVMIDLAGGRLPAGETPKTGDVDVGPGLEKITIRPELIGTGKAYFTPPTKFFKAQDNATPGMRVAPTPGPDNDGVEKLPELVDADGMPLLAWVADTTAIKSIETMADFATEVSGPTTKTVTPARFYWASNAAFLGDDATFVGKRGVDQAKRSLLGPLGPPPIPALQRSKTLGAILGSPNSPLNLGQTGIDRATLVPSAGRGPFILHAAGADGVYLGRDDKGGKNAEPAPPHVLYGSTFLDGGSNPLLDESGKTKSIDLVLEFDDILISGS